MMTMQTDSEAFVIDLIRFLGVYRHFQLYHGDQL